MSTLSNGSPSDEFLQFYSQQRARTADHATVTIEGLAILVQDARNGEEPARQLLAILRQILARIDDAELGATPIVRLR